MDSQLEVHHEFHWFFSPSTKLFLSGMVIILKYQISPLSCIKFQLLFYPFTPNLKICYFSQVYKGSNNNQYPKNDAVFHLYFKILKHFWNYHITKAQFDEKRQ